MDARRYTSALKRKSFKEWKFDGVAKERGLSKRYSVMAGEEFKEFGALESEEDHLNVLFPQHVRRQNMKKNLVWLVINVVSIVYITGLVIYF